MANQDGQGKDVGLRPGTRIGKYEVIERLAIGGQAVIYRCHDPLLDRDVAIKQVSTHLAADEEFLERFRKEAQILARLGQEQPAVVTIHELLQEEQGLFIVMEYVKGPSLERVLADNPGPTEPKAVLQILWRLAAALHDVHAAGIIHRDIKPANIIVTEGLHPKIADFGVAAGSSGQTSMVLGTTKYMAPELYGESDEPVDGRADMYSLGFIMYELLLGRDKFNEVFADITRDKHSEHLRWMKWHGNPGVKAPPPVEINPQVPSELSHIVMKMIAKDPRDRYAGMEELGRAIKLGFSPKARKAAGGSRGRSARKAGQAGRRAAGGAQVQLDDTSLGGALEGASLPGKKEGSSDSVDDAAPTAPVPKTSFSTRTKIVLAAVVVLGILGVGITLGLQKHFQKKAYQEQVQSSYAEAKKLFDERKFAESIPEFEAIREKYRDTLEYAKASVLLEVARGRVAVDSQDWKAAATARDEAKRKAILVQTKYDQPLADWASGIVETEIENLSSYYQNSRDFLTALEEAQQHLDSKEFKQARDVLRDRYGRLDAGQKMFETRYYDFIEKVDKAELENQLSTMLARGDELAEQQDYAAAAEVYGELVEKLDDPRNERLLGEDRIENLREMASMRKESMQGSREYAEAMTAAERAAKRGNLAEELKNLKAASEIRSSPQLAERIKTVESDYYVSVANKALVDGETKEAERLFVRALQVNPDNQKAKDALDELQENAEYSSLVAAGDAAMVARDWDEALEKFMDARKIRQGAELDAKIITCQFEIQLDKANQLRDEGEYAKAASAYEKAIGIKPSEKLRVESLQEAMARKVEFEKRMTAARAALEAEDFKKAINLFENAGEVYPTPPAAVADGIRDAKYGMNIRLGKEALAEGEAKSAKAYFVIAKSMKNTPEVQDLLEKAEQADQGS